MDAVNRFVLWPPSGLIVSSTSASLTAAAVLLLGAHPIIMVPACLLTGTVLFELRERARRRATR